jgi:hypothetical protein
LEPKSGQLTRLRWTSSKRRSDSVRRRGAGDAAAEAEAEADAEADPPRESLPSRSSRYSSRSSSRRFFSDTATSASRSFRSSLECDFFFFFFLKEMVS